MIPCTSCLKGATYLNDIHLFPLYSLYKAVLENPSAPTVSCPRASTSHLEDPEEVSVSTMLPHVPLLAHLESGAAHSTLLGMGASLPAFKLLLDDAKNGYPMMVELLRLNTLEEERDNFYSGVVDFYMKVNKIEPLLHTAFNIEINSCPKGTPPLYTTVAVFLLLTAFLPTACARQTQARCCSVMRAVPFGYLMPT
jgi:hypothetical protein